MEIFFAVNEAYTRQLCVAILSIAENNRNSPLNFHILSSNFPETSRHAVQKICTFYPNTTITFHTPDMKRFGDLKLNIAHISIETYFRYIIAEMMPSLDKCLYLDADIVVNGSLRPLWEMDLQDNYCIGIKDSWIERKNYKSQIGLTNQDLYINAGVILFNLKKIRQDNMIEKLFKNTIDMFDKISYQDQDIINLTFKGLIGEAESIYNFAGENVKYEKSKRKQAVIIHYTGSAKPWHEKCKNKMKNIWLQYAKKEQTMGNKKIKVGLIIDEFFGGAGTAYGGYGFLARKFIAKYIPNENIQIDVLLGKGKKRFSCEKYHEDDVDLYRLPRSGFFARHWLKKQNYDIYLSIELVNDYVLKHESNPHKKLILWIQDPRPKSAWENIINTMQSIKDPCFYHQQNYDLVHQWNIQQRVKFISQGLSLNPLALELYNLPTDTPIQYLPNPIEIDNDFIFDIKNKKKQIIFLGRLEAQKRAWLFCEVAKRMPEYEFYVLGQFFRYKEDNERMLASYLGDKIKNLHFVGHVDGEKKKKLLQESRLLLSTAIWEGIPISWLEALSYGTLLVSDLEREDLAQKFGANIGEILGDGFDKVDHFIPAIKELMENDELYIKKATTAIDYIKKTHNISRFVTDLRNVIYKETNQ